MKDHITRATGHGLRAIAAVTTATVEEARRRHRCHLVATAALGRTMTAALLLASSLKTEETVTVNIAGDGPLGGIIADADGQGFVRGYVKNPFVDGEIINGKLNVGAAVGKGYIHVTRFSDLGEPFTGSAPLITGEIGEDVTNYLLTSEQIPSTVGLGVLVQANRHVLAAGGFMIQAMPEADPASLEKIEQNISHVPPVSSLVRDGADARDILRRLFAGLSLTLHETTPVSFRCRCSRQRVANALVSLGKKELITLADEGQAEVKCEFCGEYYRFSREELLALLASADAQKKE